RVHYAVATPVAVACAVVHNVIWHRRWTWRDRRTAFWPALVRFAMSNGVVSLIGNMAVMTTLVSGAHVPAVAANLVAIVVCGLLNFVLGGVMVFRGGGRAQRALHHGGMEERRKKQTNK